MSVTDLDSFRRYRETRHRRAPVQATHLRSPAGPPLSGFIESWRLSLESANKSPKTVRSYTDSAQALCRYLAAEGLPTDVDGIDAPHVRAFLLAEEHRTSPASAAVHYRNLRVFLSWLCAEGERSAPNPMGRVEKPNVPRKAKGHLTGDDLAAMLKTCNGASFEDRRDTAIIRTLYDNGVRVSGLANLRYSENPDDNDVFLSKRRLRIRLKGGDEI